MTQDELARVPKSGASYTENAFDGNFQIHIGYEWIGTAFTEAQARQIVGSVNATIIMQKWGLHDLAHAGCQDSIGSAAADFEFWSRYAKGNA